MVSLMPSRNLLKGFRPADSDAFRRLPTDFDGFRRIPTDSDGFRRISTDFDEFRRVSTSFDEFRRVSTSFDGFRRIPTDDQKLDFLQGFCSQMRPTDFDGFRRVSTSPPVSNEKKHSRPIPLRRISTSFDEFRRTIKNISFWEVSGSDRFRRMTTHHMDSQEGILRHKESCRTGGGGRSAKPGHAS